MLRTASAGRLSSFPIPDEQLVTHGIGRPRPPSTPISKAIVISGWGPSSQAVKAQASNIYQTLVLCGSSERQAECFVCRPASLDRLICP